MDDGQTQPQLVELPLLKKLITEGETPPDDSARATAIIHPYAEAGATWWLESMWEDVNRTYDMQTRIRSGPPHLETDP